jgi:hypothetical protein
MTAKKWIDNHMGWIMFAILILVTALIFYWVFAMHTWSWEATNITQSILWDK